jgi:hypothetical protein
VAFAAGGIVAFDMEDWVSRTVHGGAQKNEKNSPVDLFSVQMFGIFNIIRGSAGKFCDCDT